MQKHYIFLFFIFFQILSIHAQKDYAKHWDKVENFELEGKTIL